MNISMLLLIKYKYINIYLYTIINYYKYILFKILKILKQ